MLLRKASSSKQYNEEKKSWELWAFQPWKIKENLYNPATQKKVV